MCKGFLMHKNLTVDPSTLPKSFKVQEVQQNKNEFIIIAPNAYHWGYNTGYNCAEAINFTSKYWVQETGYHEEVNKVKRTTTSNRISKIKSVTIFLI